MKKTLKFTFIFLVILLSGCILFESVDQPTSTLPGEVITVSIDVTTDGGEEAPYFGVCLPYGWIIPGDSICCTGVYNETIYYDSYVTADQVIASPPPDGYYWWAGTGIAIITTNEGSVNGQLEIITDDQLGLFSLDYMLGDSYGGVNLERSDNHLIEVVDEYTPRDLEAIVEETSVVLNWDTPFITAGLIGYNVYRDEQVINQTMVLETTYTDEDPLEGIHYYAVSSLYDDGSEHLSAYEIEIFFGNFYVSVEGNNSNSGFSFDDAFLSISHTLTILAELNVLHQVTIFLAPGVYSPNINGEQFPISFINYVSILGSGEGVTILDSENQNTVLGFIDVHNTSVEELTITNGSGYSGGVYCSGSSPSLENVTITDNSGSGIYCNNSNPSLENVTISDNSGSGIYCNNSNPSLENVTISGNTASESGGGIYCDNSSPSLENVTITGNSADRNGGGIYCEGTSNPGFSVDNRCSIYSNTIGSTRGFGADIFAIECDVIDVIVDTFTVMPPTDYYASPIDNFTFDILHCVIDSLIDADVYVSVDGDDSNSGIYPDSPFKTINHALSRIYFDSLNIHTIHLAPGVYSNSTNGEIFPIYWSNFVNLSGSSEEETILDAEGTSGVMEFYAITDATISNITITNGNSAEYNGGGIYCSNSDPILQNVTITGNSAPGDSGDGGGIFCCSNSSPNLTNVTISGNTSGYYGGGIFCCSNSSPNLTNVTMSDNYAGFSGGGIYCSHSSPSLVNVQISGNTASVRGGGIDCQSYSHPCLENVTISGNSANHGGGIKCSDNSNPILQNVIISGNTASDYGGGIDCFESSPSLQDVTITGNSGEDYGGGIYCCHNSNLEILNCIMWNNSPEEIFFSEYGYANSITIEYSDIEGGDAGIVTNDNGTVNWLEGNIDEDPLFVGNGEHPYLLLEDSPCIDSGIPDTTGLNLPPWDIIGNYRIWDGDGNGSAIIDMGAYEYGSPPYTDVDEPTIPNSSLLIHNLKNYPNPFNPETVISFQISDVSNQETKIEIYNVKGQKIVTLSAPMQSECIEGRQGSTYSVIWNGTDDANRPVSSGIYFYKLKAGNFEQIRKMVLLR